jgi:cyclopropane fatty-acyl-phospholipid synthase-like methyltransferase
MERLRHNLKRFLMKTRRRLYGLRAVVPRLRERHRLEAMVGPVGFWDQLQNYQLRVLCAQGLRPQQSLLDIACGPLQGGVAFIRYLEAARYTGVDINPASVAAGYAQIARYGLSAKNPTLIVSSTFGERELDGKKFDFFWASQVLYYFDNDKMSALLAFIRKRMNRGGKFLGDIHGPRHYEFKFPERGVVLHTVETLQRLAEEQGLRAHSLGEIVHYGYPRRLSLHSNLLIEFTLKE